MKIVLDAELPVAEHLAHEALGRAIAALERRSKNGDLSLAAGAGMNDEEILRLDVPIVLESDPSSPLSVHVRARLAAAVFPEFHGTIGTSQSGPARTRATLAGTYAVPLGIIGAAVNALALDRIAQRSLRRLFELLVSEANAVIRRQEEHDYRAARHFGA